MYRSSILLATASAVEMPCPKGWHCPKTKKEVNICHPNAPNCVGDKDATNDPKELKTAVDENYAVQNSDEAPIAGMHFEQADSEDYDFPAPIISEYAHFLQDHSSPFDVLLKTTNVYKGHGYTQEGETLWYSGKSDVSEQPVIKVAPVDPVVENGCPCCGPCGPQVSHTVTTVSDGHGGGYVYGQSYCSDGCHYGKGCCQSYHYYPTCAGTAYCGTSSQFFCGPPACHYGGYPCDTVNGKLDEKCPRYPCMTEKERNPFFKAKGLFSKMHLPKKAESVQVV